MPAPSLPLGQYCASVLYFEVGQIPLPIPAFVPMAAAAATGGTGDVDYAEKPAAVAAVVQSADGLARFVTSPDLNAP